MKGVKNCWNGVEKGINKFKTLLIQNLLHLKIGK